MFFRRIPPGKTYNDNGGGILVDIPIFARWAKHKYNISMDCWQTGIQAFCLSVTFAPLMTGTRLYGGQIRVRWGWLMSRFSRITYEPAGDRKETKAKSPA